MKIAATAAVLFAAIAAASAQTPATGPAPALVDPSTQVKGEPFTQKLNIGEKTPLSPAMQSVLALVVLYYAISTAEYVIAAKKEWTSVEETAGEKWLTNLINSTKSTLKTIPMICILIVFARLRAKVDLEGTNPPDYARKAFFSTVGFIYILAFSKTVFSCNVGWATMLRQIIEALCRLGLYTSIIVIFYSIFNLSKTPTE